MKATELMIGDWVFSLTKKPLRICGIEPREGSALPCTFLVNAYGNDLTYIHLGKMEIEPIPLTPEILEKNGFHYFPSATPYYYREDMDVILNKRQGSEGYYTDTLNHRIVINYVHELQHALKLCGLNDPADNFKI